MGGLEIGLLAIGAIFFIGSFFIQEKLSSSDVDQIKKLSEKEVKIILEKHLQSAETQIENAIYSKMDESFAEMERRSDRETNEKIMAIAEYSDNIISKMDKTHEEIMFMYDMLNDKQDKITQITKDAQNYESHLRGMTEEITNLEMTLPQPEFSQQYNEPPVLHQYAQTGYTQQEYANAGYTQQDYSNAGYTQQEDANAGYAQQEYSNEGYTQQGYDMSQEAAGYSDADQYEQTSVPEQESVPEVKEATPPPIALNLTAESEDDNKDKIISMYNQGYTQVEIAKKIGVGLGEIQLILGLYGNNEE